MKPSDLRETLEFLTLTQTDFARITGADGRTVRRWVSGESLVPKWVELLCRAWRHSPELVVAEKRRAKERERARELEPTKGEAQ